MLSNALQVLYALVDMSIVGHYTGSEGLAAVSLSSQCFHFMTVVCVGFCTGGQVYISQLVGSGRKDRLNRTIGTIFSTVFAIGVIVSLAGVLFCNPILRLLNAPEASYADCRDYLLVCSVGIVFTYGYNMVSAVLRGMGDSRHPFVFIVIAAVMNVILDFLFVAGFGWGVFGAALATIIAQGFSFLYAMGYLYLHRSSFGFDFKLRSYAIDPMVLKGLMKLGVPFAIRFGAVNVSMLYVLAMIGEQGHTELATFGTGVKLDNTANVICQGVTQALAAFIGQNYGARQFQRVRVAVYYAWAISIGFFLIYGVCLWFCTERMFGLFTTDAEVLKLSHVFVHAIIWHLPGLFLLKGTSGFIHGLGLAWLSLWFAVLDGFVIRIIFSWYLGIHLGMGFYGLMLGYSLGVYGMAIPALAYFFFFPWEKRKLVTV